MRRERDRGEGVEAKGRGKWESREKEMVILAHTLVYLKSWTAYVSPPPPHSAHTIPLSFCTHHAPLPLHTHTLKRVAVPPIT